MKKTYFILSVFFLWSFTLPSSCEAEKVYYTDGRINDEPVLYRDKDTIRVRRPSGDTNVDRSRIEKILNDDGSISKYDYEGVCGAIKDRVREGKYAEAAALCDILLQSFSKSAEIHYLRGVLNHKAGNLAKTKEDYNFILENNVTDAKVLNNLGTIYAADKENEKAVELFNKAIEGNPDLTEAHYNLGGILLLTRDYDGAIGEYTKVIDKEPENIEALYNLGRAYAGKKDYTLARDQWNRVLSIDKENPEARGALESLSGGN